MFIIFENRYRDFDRQYFRYIAAPGGFEIVEVDDINVLNNNVNLKDINARVLNENEVYCQLFFNMTRGYVKIKNVDGSQQLVAGSKDYFPIDEEDDPETRYYLTDSDKYHASALMKKCIAMAIENWFMYGLNSDQRIRHIEDRRRMLEETEALNGWDEVTNYWNDRFHDKLEAFVD
jgi:hypothetical protein